MANGVLNIAPRQVLGGAHTGLEEAGDPEDRVRSGELGIVGMLKGIPGAMMGVAEQTGSFMRGEIDPFSPEAARLGFDVMSTLVAPGIAGARTGALGMLGGKLAPKAKAFKFNKKQIESDISEFQEAFIEIDTTVGGVETKTIFDIGPSDRAFFGPEAAPIPAGAKSPVRATIDFEVAGIDPLTGKKVVSENALPASPAVTGDKVPTEIGQEILQGVFQTADEFIKQIKPSILSFSAARPELNMSYLRAARKLAKKHDGSFDIPYTMDSMRELNQQGVAAIFDMRFPNPKQYNLRPVTVGP